MAAPTPHLPVQAAIEAYGNGGFRFANMSHRGSILCLPSGIWAWAVRDPAGIDAESLRQVIEAGGDLDFVLLGTGRDTWLVPDRLRMRIRDLRVSLDAMPTAAAVRTYNVMVQERRRVAACLIAVE